MHKYKLEKKHIYSVQNADSGSNSGTDLGGGELIRPRRVVGVHPLFAVDLVYVVVDHYDDFDLTKTCGWLYIRFLLLFLLMFLSINDQ